MCNASKVSNFRDVRHGSCVLTLGMIADNIRIAHRET